MNRPQAGNRQLLRPKVWLSALILIFPWFIRRRIMSVLFGYSIHPTARVGRSLILCGNLVMGPASRIGNGNFINSIDSVILEEAATIGSLNWISGLNSANSKHFSEEVGRQSSLFIGRHAALTARHFVDCCNKVSIGAFSIVAGARSQILTHAVDIRNGTQRSAPVVIGEYCFVGTGVIILKGSRLPNYSVLAAGSTLHKAFDGEHMIYSGVPAAAAKELDAESRFFQRETGFVP